MIPEKRRNRVTEYLKKNKTATIAEISKNFNISEITVRRDFDKLSKQGLIKKVYGGATIIENQAKEPYLLQRLNENIKEKRKIADEAVKKIKINDTILIEAGSTCLELVKKLGDISNIKVITAAPHIINALIDLKRNGAFNGEIMCCGGIWQGDPDDFFVGPQSMRFFGDIKIDISFFGIYAIDLENGWSTPSVFEAELTKRIISSSKKVIGITDHTKFNRSGFARVGEIKLFDEIITDSGINEKDLKNYTQKTKVTAV